MRTSRSSLFDGWSFGPVRVGAAEHPDDCDLPTLVINSVDDSVGPAACAMAAMQRRAELLAHAVRIVQQRTDDEFVGRERHRFRKSFG